VSLNNKHILQIVIKNTSTLDFTIPLFWKMKQEYPNVQISILYLAFSKKEILREGGFYSNFFKSHNINEYDLSDFIKWPKNRTNLGKNSKADRLSLYEIKKNIKRFKISILKDIFIISLEKINEYFLQNIVNYRAIIRKINPDIYFFDIRKNSKFIGKNKLYKIFYEQEKPLYLIPHAPHMRDPISEFVDFDKCNQLPNFCRFWIPFKYGTPWLALTEDKKDQFFISGYPGFDDDWLTYCRNLDNHKNEEINILFIIRRFLSKGVERSDEVDSFIIDYNDFMRPLAMIKESISRIDRDINVIIKPHPGNNYSDLTKAMNESGLKKWEISHEPMYASLPKVDIAISLASTTLLTPAFSNIPTIILNTDLQRQIHEIWVDLKDMYTGMHFYLDDNSKFEQTLLTIINENNFHQKEEHLRNFYDNNASELIIKRIRNELIK